MIDERRLHRLRVLLVDDDPRYHQILGAILSKWGVETTSARDGPQALKILEEDAAPRIVLLDWDLPGMSGLEVCSQVRSRPAVGYVYVLMISAMFTTPAHVVTAFQSGADAFVPKGLENLELLRGHIEAASRLLESRAVASGFGPAVPGYELISRISEGAFGVVYRAKAIRSGLIVAVKVVRFAAGDVAAPERFRREILLTSQLQHPNIVRIYDYGMDDSKGFYAMEYVDGPTLAQLFTERRPSRYEALEICLRLCDAMGTAHRAGIIHRDLKLTNVMMDGTGEPRVVDFGLARVVRSREDTHSLLTIDGQVLGTPLYMSPEQALGRQSQVGPSSDVYALGVMLYWMLTGVFPRSNAMAPLDLLGRAAGSYIVAPNAVLEDLDPRLERILIRSLAPRRDDRFADADAMGAALRQYIGEGSATN